MSESPAGSGQKLAFDADLVGLGGFNLTRIAEQFGCLRSYITDLVSANPYDVSFGTGDKLSEQIREAFLPAMAAGTQIMDGFWSTFQGAADALGLATTALKDGSVNAAETAGGGHRR